MVTPDVNKQNH